MAISGRLSSLRVMYNLCEERSSSLGAAGVAASGAMSSDEICYE